MTRINEYYTVVRRTYSRKNKEYINVDGLLRWLSECVRLQRVMKSQAGSVSYSVGRLRRLAQPDGLMQRGEHVSSSSGNCIIATEWASRARTRRPSRPGNVPSRPVSISSMEPSMRQPDAGDIAAFSGGRRNIIAVPRKAMATMRQLVTLLSS